MNIENENTSFYELEIMSVSIDINDIVGCWWKCADEKQDAGIAKECTVVSWPMWTRGFVREGTGSCYKTVLEEGC